MGAVDEAPARFDRLAQQHVMAVVSDTLTQLLADDPTVYIIRQVEAELMVCLTDSLSDTQLAQQWGQNLATAILRSLNRADVVRFDNQADYVAHFLGDLLEGRAWQRWYYNRFKMLEPMPVNEAVATVLRDNQTCLAEIWGYLHQHNTVELVLHHLDAAMLNALWPVDNTAALRPLFEQVLRLADRLGHNAENQARDGEAVWLAYIQHSADIVDWRDQTSLTAVVVSMLRFMAQSGHLGQLVEPSQRDAILAEFDWLNLDWIRAELAYISEVYALVEQVLRWLERPASEVAVLWTAYLRLYPLQYDRRVSLTAMLSDILQFLSTALPQHIQPDTLPDDTNDKTQPIYRDAIDVAVNHSAMSLQVPKMLPVIFELLRQLERLNLSRAQRQMLESTLWRTWNEWPSISTVMNELLNFLATQQQTVISAQWVTRFANLTKNDERLLMQLMFGLFKSLEVASSKPARIPDLLAMPQEMATSPRLHRLLQHLIQRVGTTYLNRKQPDSPDNALRLYAALVAKTPEWNDNVMASTVIQRLLTVWHTLTQNQTALQHWRAGDSHRALRALASEQQGQVSAALQAWGHLGETLLTRLIQPDESFETHCAGVFLLLRAMLDTRLASVVKQADYPDNTADLSALGAVILALGLRWAGPDGFVAGQLDPALSVLAGLKPTVSFPQLRLSWLGMDAAANQRFQAELLRVLVEQHLMQGITVHLYQVGEALVAGDDTGQLGVLGQITRHPPPEWTELWKRITGQKPIFVASDAATLSTALTTLNTGQFDLPASDLTLNLAANAVLRQWARWLRQFSGSSTPYLLAQFIRRPGHVTVSDRRIVVDLDPRPLDVVLEMAGYLAPLEQVPWLGYRTVTFKVA